METKTLIVKKYPKVVQNFAAENFNLKTLVAALLVLSLGLLLLVVYLAKRGPNVIALDAGGEIAKIELKVTDAQISKAAEEYLSFRYGWRPENIGEQLKKSEAFIDPMLIGSFRKSMLEVQKFVKEKKVQQRVYPFNIKVDLKQKKISVLADRITEFESLAAASKLKVIFDFALGDRTPVNPWGIYISKESEGEFR